MTYTNDQVVQMAQYVSAEIFDEWIAAIDAAIDQAMREGE